MSAPPEEVTTPEPRLRGKLAKSVPTTHGFPSGPTDSPTTGAVVLVDLSHEGLMQIGAEQLWVVSVSDVQT